LGAPLALIVLGLPFQSAKADTGELALGAGITTALPRAAGLELGLRLGVGDFLAVDARAGGGTTAKNGFGFAEGGLVALFDVLTWVPEMRIAVGAELSRDDVSPVVRGSLGLRRYLTGSVSAAVEAGGAWTPEGWRATLALSFWLAIP